MADKSISETVEKALVLLTALSEAGPDGLTLADAAARAGTSKPTAHRLLNTLVQQAFAERPPGSRSYRLGPAIGALARADAAQDLHDSRWRTCLAEVSAALGASAFLMVRAGDEALCVQSEFGALVVPTLTAGTGGRVPLGLGPGSLAILSTLGDEEVTAILARNAPRLQLDGTRTLASLAAQVARIRQDGHAYDPGEILAEVRGLALPTQARHAPLPMALSIAILASRLSKEAVPAACATMRAALARAGRARG